MSRYAVGKSILLSLSCTQDAVCEVNQELGGGELTLSFCAPGVGEKTTKKEKRSKSSRACQITLLFAMCTSPIIHPICSLKFKEAIHNIDNVTMWERVSLLILLYSGQLAQRCNRFRKIFAIEIISCVTCRQSCIAVFALWTRRI